MNNENRLKMIEALRSGKYQQTRNSLARWDNAASLIYTYCCIGAAAVEIAKMEVFDEFKACNVSTEKAAKSIGLNNAEQFVLVSLNDIQRKSFDQVADFMETGEFVALGQMSDEVFIAQLDTMKAKYHIHHHHE